ncbi:Protein CWC15 [Trichinella spiralis]|uniref:Protein CWC15 n=1 Tax=Trichinella spiralis TaxID=6334 RepID=A0ABR3K3P7_TRISP
MTTAHRATFVPAHGGTGKNEGDLSKLSKQYSSRDMPSHTKIKYRQHSQGHADELRNRDFRRELEDRERNTGSKRRPENNYDDPSSYSHDKKVRYEKVSYRNPDDDDPSICEEDDDSNDSDEDDETAQLMAELERIKKEREAERKEEEAKRKAEEERVRVENILRGNPLLTSNKQDFRVQRRWDDDVESRTLSRSVELSKDNRLRKIFLVIDGADNQRGVQLKRKLKIYRSVVIYICKSSIEYYAVNNELSLHYEIQYLKVRLLTERRDAELDK